MCVERMIALSRRINYADLQRSGGILLREFAVRIVGSEYAFKEALTDTLDRPKYSIDRYMYSLTQELLRPNFDRLEQAIKEALDVCSEKNDFDVDPEKVKERRKCSEHELMQKLRELHGEADERYISN